jgi:hypothetical protein
MNHPAGKKVAPGGPISGETAEKRAKIARRVNFSPFFGRLGHFMGCFFPQTDFNTRNG